MSCVSPRAAPYRHLRPGPLTRAHYRPPLTTRHAWRAENHGEVMKFSAQLDVNVVAHESDDEVAVLLDLAAPSASTDQQRPPASLQIVLDRSGSMAGPPLDGALKALAGLVQRLDSQDNFGLVAFDDTAQVVVPAGPLTNKAHVLGLISALRPGGLTDLSSGYLRGLQELRRVVGDSGGTLLLISDGHVNAGVSEPDKLGDLARGAYGAGLTTSTLGYGLDYDETLLTAITRGGSGNHHFAQDPDAAGAAISSEVTGLLSKSIQAASLLVHCEPSVQLWRLYNDLPCAQVGPSEVMIELGDLYVEEERKILLKFKVPAMPSLGLALVAKLQLRYVELPDLLEQVVTIPVTVNVVPGDQAAGRTVDPTVHTEVLFQEAQHSKRLASEALELGDRETAKRLLDGAVDSLEQANLTVPADLREDLVIEVDALMMISEQVDLHDTSLTSKMTRASYHDKNRKRGRRTE